MHVCMYTVSIHIQILTYLYLHIIMQKSVDIGDGAPKGLEVRSSALILLYCSN